MDNKNHCMSIKQARLIVNAHKHNLLINSFEREDNTLLHKDKDLYRSVFCFCDSVCTRAVFLRL